MAIQRTTTSVVVHTLFPKHKACIVFDPIFSWMATNKPPEAPSRNSDEWLKVECLFYYWISHFQCRTSLNSTTEMWRVQGSMIVLSGPDAMEEFLMCQKATPRKEMPRNVIWNYQRTESLTLLTVVDRDSHYVSYITAAVEAFLFGKKVPEQALTGFDNVALCYCVLQCLATNGKTLPTTV